ncbi:hypothetical protein BI049_gp114 [Salmonella phage vB_SnwM_CGG4-1]|uniref:Uncharacterized protein n=1 Tax=Salmonella phage vB_SnwM_CGG4-1 TaxID=1815631 RepID=A0A1B0VVB3_9CAUD|nr:hypothetical protein BI049_gp114 [Salmonella phage vB_SnwM_CGG4-1]ANA49468.1 hypothetical protein CGG41_113 [Salmonella phage vB_SnwM_CGG4-1]
MKTFKEFISESEHVKRVPDFKDVDEAVKFFSKAETKAGKEKRRDELVKLLKDADKKDKRGEGSKDHHAHKEEVRKHLEELAKIIRP